MTRPPPPPRHPWRPPLLLAGLAAVTTLTSGCAQIANLGVQPWERDLMAKPSMQLVSAPLDAAADDHIYFSKEAASGGRGFGGGGCGCN